jgi:hypothetical protein
MVPVVVRLEQAGVCGCGEVVAAGERAGTTRQPGHVVCLTCVAAFSTDPDDAEPHDGGYAPELPAPVAVVIPADWASPAPITLPAWQRSAGVATALPPALTLAPRPAPPAAPAAPPALVPPVPAPPAVAAAPATPPDEQVPVPTAATADSAPAPSVQAATSPRVVDSQPAAAARMPRGSGPESPPAVEVAAPTAQDAPVAAPVQDATPPPVAEVTTPDTEVVDVPPADVPATAEAVAMAVPSHRRRTLLPAGLLGLRPSRGRQPGSTGQSDAATRAVLDSAGATGVLALHDRRVPGRRSRIAHLAFGAGGVYVIDVVRANKARIEVLPGDDLDSHPRDLLVGGRPMTGTVEATQARVAIVRALLEEVELSSVPVIGVMYFVDATVPSDSELEVAGVRVVGRGGLAALVASDGAFDVEHRETLREYLTERLPA